MLQRAFVSNVGHADYRPTLAMHLDATVVRRVELQPRGVASARTREFDWGALKRNNGLYEGTFEG